MLDHSWQIPVRKGLSPIKANATESGLFRVVQQMQNGRKRELMSVHKFPAVVATAAGEIAVGRDGDEQGSRLWPDYLWNDTGYRVMSEVRAPVEVKQGIAEPGPVPAEFLNCLDQGRSDCETLLAKWPDCPSHQQGWSVLLL
jgi:hypothetical protein